MKLLTRTKSLMETNLKGVRVGGRVLRAPRRGKVRDTYDLGDGRLLIVATDRISTFDHTHPTGIPGKGRLLTSMSNFWFGSTRHIVGNHLVESDFRNFPRELRQFKWLAGRSVIVHKAKVVPIECVVRGYLSGSGWKEYSVNGRVCGIKLRKRLVESDKLGKPIFTPATKAPKGMHDENISFKQMARKVGLATAKELRRLSLLLYAHAAEHARKKGVIIADTKFEFGILPDGRIILIDEALTPDSSRFWPLASYKPGGPQPSFDKQFVRDWVEKMSWDKKPPAPHLPKEVVDQTIRKYLEAHRRITGRRLVL